MSAHARYLRYVVRHKWYVARAGVGLNVPLWRLIVHDWSKFLPVEWGPYARRYGVGRSGVIEKLNEPPEYHRAWTHHWHWNPHHWEHWLVFNDDGTLRPLPMPETYVREMVADWMGAGRAITGKWEVGKWYAANGPAMQLHPETRALATKLVEVQETLGRG
jgi:hypothetical protein